MTEKNQILALEILQYLNKSQEAHIMVGEILQMIKKHTGIKAVGIRLHDGEDYPYFTYDGFSENFVSPENYLCAKDEKGNIIHDISGNPKLECMCGIVLSKQTNSAKPFFTEYGSFWCNSTSELYESLSDAERAIFTHGRCIREGYESLALIPLCNDDEIIGLLQLNDHRKNCLSLELIKFFEGIGNSIGISLKLCRMMEEERKKARICEAVAEQYRKDLHTIKEIEKLKDELASFIVHDLRSPLTFIKGYLEIISKSKNLEEQDLRDISRMEQSVNILIDMTANLLDITKIESKELKIPRVSCNLSEIIDSAVQQIEPQITAKSINFSNNTQGENIVVKVEKDLIRRVVLNILSNAMRFLPEKGEITIVKYPIRIIWLCVSFYLRQWDWNS